MTEMRSAQAPGFSRGEEVNHWQGYRIELDPTETQRARPGQHAGLFRVVENFCLGLVKSVLAEREPA